MSLETKTSPILKSRPTVLVGLILEVSIFSLGSIELVVASESEG